MRNSTSDSRDRFVWRWSPGFATVAAFGDPLTTTAYAFCIYDETAGVPQLWHASVIPPGGICSGDRPCWKSMTRGFRYDDRSAGAGGIRSLKLGAGDGRARIDVKGQGNGLAWPAPALPERWLSQHNTVTVQVVNSHGACWATRFSAPATRNSSEAFADKSD